MTRVHRSGKVLSIAVVAVVAAGGSWALAATTSGAIHACANKKSGALRLAGKCSKKHERAVSWNITGPQGLRGATGAKGTNGINGTNGTNGTNGATKVVVRQTFVSMPTANTFYSGTAQCNPGEVATGGGVNNNLASNTARLVLDNPNDGNATSPPTSWIGGFMNGATADSFNVYVICASP
jgi:predicted ribonuclease toxin of YeeF-YezG toxin-antitoxin module